MIVFLLYMLVSLALVIPGIAVGVRRLHDTDRSGWWILAPLAGYALLLVGGLLSAASPDNAGIGGILAIVGGIAVLGLGLTVLVFMFLEGTRGPNRYGPDPKGAPLDEVFA